MCQGAIISIVKWRNGRKTERVVLAGIGSHSTLLADNQKILIKKGWKEDAPSQDVISIESDFSKGFGHYTIEHGKPSKSERAILDREFKRIAGDARSLILHVKKCGKIDLGLTALLTAQALAEYERVTAQAWAEYQRVTAPALAEYQRVKAQAWVKLFKNPKNRVRHLQ